MIRSRGWRLPALLATLFLIGVLAPATATAQQWPPEARMVGQVTQNGQPLAGYRVHAVDATSHQLHGSTTTDANGDYALSLEPSFTYKLQFTSPDFRRTQWAHNQTSFQTAQVFSVAWGQVTVVDEAIAPTGTLVVTIADEVTGAPVSSFSVEANGPSFGGGYTDTGSVTMTDLLPGEYQVIGYPSDHHDARGTATVTANETTEVRLTAEPLPPAGRLEATVVDAATNAPVENACIRPVRELDVFGLYPLDCSGPDGRITVDRLEPGSYRVYAKTFYGTHGAQWVGRDGGTGSRYLATRFDVRAEQTTTMPTIRLDRPGTITGKVTDKATGTPVPAMCAYPHATSTAAGPEPGPHCSDANGDYTITGLGPYHWPVEFVGDYTNGTYAWQWSGGRPNQLLAQPTQVRAGQTSTLNAQLTPGATIRGRVLAADGTPVSGAVQAYNALTGDPASDYALTDENGYYEVRSLAGQFVRLEFWPDLEDDGELWYRNASGFHSATPVWVSDGGTRTGVDFTIPAA